VGVGDWKTVNRQFVAIAIFSILYVGLATLVDNSYYRLMMIVLPIWATLGLSWNLFSGYSGLVSFGHAAFFGLGAYTATLLLIYFDIPFWFGIPAGMLIGAVAAVLIGYPTFRLTGVYFALAMLAYPLALLYFFEWLGYQEVSIPRKLESPIWHMEFENNFAYVVIATILMALAMLVSAVVERTRFGMSLLAIKQNQLAAEAAGINTRFWKMMALMLSGAIAAAAGAYYAKILLVVSPASVFGMNTSAQALIIALFGGAGTLWGPVIGASILIPLSETLHAELGHIVPGIQGVTFGAAIILIVLLAPEGLYWKVRDRIFAARKPSEVDVVQDELQEPLSSFVQERRQTFGPPILEVRGVSKSFGGLQAVADVTLDVKAGMILGIIGPNGAGKSTFFNALNGCIRPSAGTIHFKGKNIVGLMPHGVCSLGIGRTFQVAQSFPRMTLLQNVLIGAYVGAKTDEEAWNLARSALSRVGLSRHADALAGGMTTKQLRLMELARALAPKPSLILMDEPLAGLAREDIDDLLIQVRRLREEGCTIVIIEHTMHAMVRLVDHMVVLDRGRLIASGAPEAVMQDKMVIEAYLGKKWARRVA
jgi:ABC-type branched-subunit amino acid transport system ATPase component/ABC-type branched-subunit amino acid transport system permease subunit